MLNGKRILVTGGAGFIGSHVVDALLSEGAYVTIYDNFSAGKKENVSPHVKVVKADVQDEKALAKALEGIDGVVHLAAQVSVPFSIENPKESDENNIISMSVLCKELANASFKGLLVYASSAAVYGHKKQGEISKEVDTLNPLSPYALEKSVNEQQAKMAHELWGIKSLGLRFFNVYGSGQSPTSSYAGVISIFVDQLKKGKAVKVYGNGEQIRDFIYVKDVAKVVAQALLKTDISCDICNVSTGEGVSLHGLLESLSDILNKKAQVDYLPKRMGDIQFSTACIQRQNHIFKHKPYTLLEGLKDWLS